MSEFNTLFLADRLKWLLHLIWNLETIATPINDFLNLENICKTRLKIFQA